MARNEWEVGNVLSPWKTKRLSKPTEIMLKVFKSQLKEVYADHSLDNLSININN